MKPFIEKLGIKPKLVKYDSKFGTVEIKDFRSVFIVGRVKCIQGKLSDGQKVNIKLEGRTDLAEMLTKEDARFDLEFEARYPGILKIVSAQNDECNYLEDFEEMMEDEQNDGVNPPVYPKESSISLKNKYPVAAAYLNILAFSKKIPACESGDQQRIAADKAFNRILAGANVLVAEKEMIADYEDSKLS